MVLSLDFKEFIESLNSNDVRYLIIGGYALAAYGHPRYTKDLDVFLDATEENAKKVIQALKEFGFGSLGLKESDFSEPEQMIQLGYPPNRIDLLTSADGIEFIESFESRQIIIIDGIPISFIGLEQLKANKRATGRKQDEADLEALDGM